MKTRSSFHLSILVSAVVGLVAWPPGAVTGATTLTVDGSNFNAGATFKIDGSATYNSLIITNAGSVSNGVGYVGFSSGTDGDNNSALVTGTGSVWTNVGILYIGNDGTNNVLAIQDGGQVISGHLEFSDDAGANGNIYRAGGVGAPSYASHGHIYLEGGGYNTMIVTNIYLQSTGGVNAYGTNNTISVLADAVWNNGNQNLYNGALAAAVGNRLLIDGGVVTNVSYFGVGISGGKDNQLTVRNGGQLYASHFRIGYDSGATGNVAVVDGSVIRANQSRIGYGLGANNSLILSNGGQLVVSGSLYVGEESSGNSLTLRDGGQSTGGELNVGRQVGATSNTFHAGGVGAQSSATFGNVYLGAGGGAYNTLTLSNVNFQSTGDIISYHTNNTILVRDGAVWNAGGQLVYVGYLAAAVGNTFEIDGGVVTNVNSVRVGEGDGKDNALNIRHGGQLLAKSLEVGTATDGTSNRLLVTSGGLIEANTMLADTASGNSISNIGGIYQFTTATPTITPNGADRISVTDGTISFRGITNANVFANVAGAANQLTNIAFAGNNTFRLNASSNASGVAAYTFDTGRGATNYTRLEMVNDTTLWRSGTLTVGSGGSLLASNTTAIVSASVISTGAISVVNSKMTWSSNVVIAGSYGSDPSTNTFLSDLTVTPSGSLAGGVSDLFDFEKNLIIQSTNNQAFELHTSAVKFTGGGMHTNEITGLDLGSGVAAYDAAFSYGTNFAYGELHLGSASDEICFTCTGAASSNALYVGWLDLLGDTNYVANLHAPTNLTIYYAMDDVRNAYLGNQSYNLLDCDGALGGLLMPVVPEPTTMAFLVMGGLLLARRRRHERV